MKEENTEYFTEEELADFIADMEADHPMQAPDYLAELILHKAERQALRESVEIIPIRNTIRETIREGKPAAVPPASKQKQLLVYSIKIIAAAAAAIALIIMTPSMETHLGDQSDSYQVQYDQNGQKDEKSMIQNLNEKSSDFCSRLFYRTNQLFHREDN